MKRVILSFLRYLARRRSLAVLQLLGIAFGVAAAVGMTLASRSALESMEGAVDFLKGGSTHTIQRPAGPMEEGLLARIMNDPSVKFFAPVIDRKVRLATGDQVRLLGVDPFLDKNVRSITREIASSANSSGRDEAFLSFLLDPGTVLIDENTAKAGNIAAGQSLMTMQGPLKVVQVFPNPSGEPLVIMDIGHAQEFFKMAGYIDRADLVVTDEEALRKRWSQGLYDRIQPAEGRVIIGTAWRFQAEPPGPVPARTFCRHLPHIQYGHVYRCKQAQGCRDTS